ncbi:DUF2062 domain-containing protein [Flavobacterium selenitireducens]|uniref:DUF2062 domain-containing protein n=1 Tax=Flavobacterium selenitireducens TaxID=2722704 RepID=UPI001CC2F644|nr:DUF2062 domain-containing protein [Flavobacterium selenitireducens]MBD3582180.1 DUF2062 domain-containing protein [Flavobacterium selenitireducens]
MTQVTQQMEKLNVCVIIPTYNNHKTLRRVIDSVLAYTADVIVVNDGATDSTPEILSDYPQLTIVTHPQNIGKGMALRNGFAKAREMGFDYAITIDSDGQHFASDLPVFLDSLESEGEALLIGGRNMTQEGVPKKSSFGNNFSNFWFWFETGIRLEDTQSGYRLYPLKRIPKKYFTKKFEFEIEVIVRSAWRDIPVKNVPIQVLYDPSERVSHFRPFKDFTRISILNTVLVTICLLWIFPRNLFRKLKKKGLKKFLLENVLHSEDSNRVKALSIALGVFIGISPFWGFQTVLSLFLATVFRLNKAIAYIFSNVSIPPMIPPIVAASLWIGSLVYDTGAPLFPQLPITFEKLKDHLGQYLIGSLTLAAIASVVAGFLSYGLLSVFKKESR